MPYNPLQLDEKHGCSVIRQGRQDQRVSCFSLVETAKANGLEPYAYLEYILQRTAAADTLEKLEALLP